MPAKIMPTPKLVINLSDGSVSFSLAAVTAQELLAFLLSFVETIKQTAPDRKATMEYRHIGEVFLEVFGNPNIYANSFTAKVLVTLRDDKIKLTTEIGLTRLIEDVQQYLEQVNP